MRPLNVFSFYYYYYYYITITVQLYNFASLKVVSFAVARAGVMQASCPQIKVVCADGPGANTVRANKVSTLYLGIAPMPKCGIGYLKKGCVHISAQGVLYLITVPCNQV